MLGLRYSHTKQLCGAKLSVKASVDSASTHGVNESAEFEIVRGWSLGDTTYEQ